MGHPPTASGRRDIAMRDLPSSRSFNNPYQKDEDTDDEGSTSRAAESPSATSQPLLRHDRTPPPGTSRSWLKFTPFARRKPQRSPHSAIQRRPVQLCMTVGLALLALLGILQILTIAIHLTLPLFSNGIQHFLRKWDEVAYFRSGLGSWQTDFTRDIRPVPCHSHNDYWRRVPLYSAIEAGCTGVEADIWLYDEELYVGHSISSLTPNRTLHNLYIRPLREILEGQNPRTNLVPGNNTSLNGVFDTEPAQSLILLVDFKTLGSQLWPVFYRGLDPLRSAGYLTHINESSIVRRPITVVGTGNTPFSMVDSDEHNPHRDVFFDAPLDLMRDVKGLQGSARSPSPHAGAQEQTEDTLPADAYTPLNSFYASVAFSQVIGHLDHGAFTKSQMETLQLQIKGAQQRGLKVRYWDTPSWPIGLRNKVWDTLVDEGVDMLNVDDLQSATHRDWNKQWSWWKRS